LDLQLFKKIHEVDISRFFDEQFREKALLKKAYLELLPNSIVQRTKFPFRAPDSMAFCTSNGSNYVMDTLNSHHNYESIFVTIIEPKLHPKLVLYFVTIYAVNFLHL
jgi:hypothetical protein